MVFPGQCQFPQRSILGQPFGPVRLDPLNGGRTDLLVNGTAPQLSPRSAGEGLNGKEQKPPFSCAGRQPLKRCRSCTSSDLRTGRAFCVLCLPSERGRERAKFGEVKAVRLHLCWSRGHEEVSTRRGPRSISLSSRTKSRRIEVE